MEVKMRQVIERTLVRCTIDALLAAGFSLRVNDGEDYVTSWTTDKATLLNAMFSTDEDILFAKQKGVKGQSRVKFVYGNDGTGVVSDYTVNLEQIMDSINGLSNQIERGEFEISFLPVNPFFPNGQCPKCGAGLPHDVENCEG